ncbi:MAG: flagellar biosynthetic protein FliR [Proteobacteria bacterium]|nr:flagellar biosynthetic protein FliR [Pseudomonadota bacterium]NBX86407.1 flagellar biosynthetic protein FliR [Pseudomonadota bacterium]
MIGAYLAELLVFPFFLIFARLGAAVMVFPALSDMAVPVRFRLLMAVAISAVFFPLLQPGLPAMPGQTGAMLALVLGEIFVGILMALGARLFIAAFAVAGEIIAFMAGFQSATLFDPQSASNTVAPTLFLSITAAAMLLALNLHHDLIRAVAASYVAFPAGVWPEIEDVNMAVIEIVAQLFALGVQLAAPIILVGLLANALFGVLGRLIPQLQVFYVSIPVSITLSLLVLAAGLSAMMELWTDTVAGKMSVFQIEESLR